MELYIGSNKFEVEYQYEIEQKSSDIKRMRADLARCDTELEELEWYLSNVHLNMKTIRDGNGIVVSLEAWSGIRTEESSIDKAIKIRTSVRSVIVNNINRVEKELEILKQKLADAKFKLLEMKPRE